MKKLSMLAIALLFFAAVTYAQAIYDKPEIGKPIANVHFDNVQYFAKRSLSLKELRGKWVLLDFWHTGCKANVKTLEEVNELQKEFKNEIQFVMVCTNNKKYD